MCFNGENQAAKPRASSIWASPGTRLWGRTVICDISKLDWFASVRNLAAECRLNTTTTWGRLRETAHRTAITQQFFAQAGVPTTPWPAPIPDNNISRTGVAWLSGCFQHCDRGPSSTSEKQFDLSWLCSDTQQEEWSHRIDSQQTPHLYTWYRSLFLMFFLSWTTSHEYSHFYLFSTEPNFWNRSYLLRYPRRPLCNHSGISWSLTHQEPWLMALK